MDGDVYTISSGDTNELNKIDKATPGFFNDDFDWSGATIIKYSQVEDVAVGNFDGNIDGREQVAFVTLSKQNSINNGYSRMFIYNYTPGEKEEEGTWSYSVSEQYVSHKGKAFATLTAFDYDTDSVIAEFENIEKTYSKPDVLAVLEAAPYFEELDPSTRDYSSTEYSTSTGDGSIDSTSHSLHTNIVAGFDAADPITNSGGGFETTIENNLTWTAEAETTRTFTLNFANHTGVNQVIVYRVPVVNYTYRNVNNGLPIHIQKALDAEYAMITLADYNDQAAVFGLTQIDEDKLCKPGDPFSYPSTWADATTAQLAKNETSEMSGTWVNYQTNGYVTQSFAYEETKAEDFTYDLSVDFTAYATIFGTKVGGGAGYGFESRKGTITTNGIDKYGTVEGIGSLGLEGYNFQWQFAHWMADFQGKKVPVLGYLVQNQIAPPSPPTDIDGSLSEDQSTLTLTWNSGSRPADTYKVYSLDSQGNHYVLGTIDRPDKNGIYSFDISGLDNGRTYTYAVRGVAGGKESVDSRTFVLTTNPDDTQLVTISKVEDTTVAAGRDAEFKVTVANNGGADSYHSTWQCREKNSNAWQDVANANVGSAGLLLKAVTQDMDGNQYRLHVSAVKGSDTYNYYSNVVTLHIGANPTSAAVSLTGYTGGNGKDADPYTGQGAYTKYEDKTVKETRDVTLEVVNSDHNDPVYKVGDTYVAVHADHGTGSSGYYEVTFNENGGQPTDIQVKEILPVKTKWYKEKGEGASSEQFDPEKYGAYGLDPDTIVFQRIENSDDVYYQKAEWIEENGSIEVKTYWLKGNEESGSDGADGEKYKPDKSGYGFTVDTEFTDFAADKDVQISPVCYYIGSDTEIKLILENDDGFFMLKKDGDTWTKDDDFQNVTAKKFITVNEEEVDVDTIAATPYTYKEEESVTVSDPKPVEGTNITLSAALYYGNDEDDKKEKLPDGTKADFIITNLNTGAVITINATVTDGKITANWTAPAPGLYAIRASATATATLAASTSDVVYYKAEGDTSKDEYRLTKAGAKVPPEAVVYGDTVELAFEKRPGGDTYWSVENTEGKYIELVNPDGTSDKIDSLTLETFGRPAGTYSVRVWNSSEDYQKALNEDEKVVNTAAVLASVSFLVDYAEVTISPDLNGYPIPNKFSDIGIKFILTKGNANNADDFRNLEDNFEVVCDLYDTAGNIIKDNYGRYVVSLQWKKDSEGNDSEYEKKIEASYRVTFETDLIERLREQGVVKYRAGDGGGLNAGSFDGSSYLNFASGTSQKYGVSLQFAAVPDTGKAVQEWKKNGEPLDRNNLPDNVTISSTDKSVEVLTLTNFNETDLVENELNVEVSFSSKVIKVHYSCNEGGTITADVPNDSNVFYGSNIVFTAAPNAGQMVKEWQVNGVTRTYPGGGTYRENTLTLTNIQQADLREDNTLTVSVTFEPEQNTEVSFSMVTGDIPAWAEPFAGGTIEVTAVDGQPIDGYAAGAAGKFSVTQGRALTFTVKDIANPAQNQVDKWQYRTDPEGDWLDVPESSNKSSITYEVPKASILQVRACIVRLLTYNLSWEAAMQDNAPVPEDAAAEFTVRSNGVEIKPGSHTPNIPVEFTLHLNNKYRVVKWVGATQDPDDPNRATIASLSGNTAVQAIIAEKPKYEVKIAQPDNNALEIQAYVDGEPQTSPFTVHEGTKVTFSYTYTDTGALFYVFDGWLVNGVSTSGSAEPELALTITGPTEVAVKTTRGSMRRLTLALGGNTGTSTVKAAVAGFESDYGPEDVINIPLGSAITLVAEPDNGQMIDHWEVNGQVQKTAAGRNELGLQLPTFTLADDTTVTVFFTEKAEYPYPAAIESETYTVEIVSSYPSGENSGVTPGYYRKGGDLKFTLKPVDSTSEELLLPCIDGFFDKGDEVIITENDDGDWDVEIKGVTDKIDLPTFRVEMKESIPDDAVYDLKEDTAFERLRDYLPAGTTKDDINGEIIEEAMENIVKKIVAEEMPGTPEDNKAVYDVTLKQYVEGEWKPVTVDDFPNDGLIVILPYPEGTDSNDSFTVVHMITSGDAAGTTETFSSQEENSLFRTAAGLQFRVSSLSPIAVIWTEYVPPAGGGEGGGGGGFGGGGGGAAAGGGGGGGGAAPTANVVVSSAANGTVTVSDKAAEAGDNVKLTPKAADGYLVDAVTVTDKNGRAIDVKNNGDGTYSFVMPEEERLPVNVTVTFKADPAAGVPAAGFVDVEPDAWYREGVEYAVANGLMNGTSANTFAPNDTTTRAMIVTILYRLEGEPAATKNLPFADVAAGKWYSDAVNWASTNGVVTGYDENTFGPDDPITREQLAAILYRYAAFKGYGVTEKADLAAFADAGAISAYAQESMSWANNNGLIGGVSADLLQPQGSAVRAQVAVILMRFCESVAK